MREAPRRCRPETRAQAQAPVCVCVCECVRTSLCVFCPPVVFKVILRPPPSPRLPHTDVPHRFSDRRSFLPFPASRSQLMVRY